MALTTKRIINLPTQNDPQSGDYLVIDNGTNGTHKIPVERIGVELDDTLSVSGKAADAKATGDAIDALGSQLEVTGTASGAIATFSDGSTMPAKSVIVNIEPQQSGSGTPSPDNVRPISGWSSVDVYKSGKNLSEVNETEATTSGRYILNNANLPNSDYVISFELVNTTCANSGAALLDLYDANDVNFAYPTPSQFKRVSDDVQMSSLSQPINGRFYYRISAHSLKRIGLQFRSDAWGGWTGTMKAIQLEVGTEVTDYSPTTKDTIPVNLGRTVYGGTLDVVSGVLTAYPFYPSYNGETLNGRWVCDRAVYAEGTTPPTGSQVALISGTGTTYTLTPTQINTLLGENNVWADSGDISVTYVRDLNIAINNLIGE